jgi:hypothetical protein
MRGGLESFLDKRSSISRFQESLKFIRFAFIAESKVHL